MSLNGLDSQKVVDAHRQAIADPAGWFLLQYISRDELAVLDKGSGSHEEVVMAIGRLEEKSPLYGFFLYRRHKVLLKYVPEDVSRLLKARVSVHFKALQDYFSHDAVLEASSPEDLNDGTLSAACSLHTDTPQPLLDAPQPPQPPQQRTLSDITQGSEPQSSNPEVSSILARLRANKLSQDRATLNSSPDVTETRSVNTPKASEDFSTTATEFYPTLSSIQAADEIPQNASQSSTARVASALDPERRSKEDPVPATVPEKSRDRTLSPPLGERFPPPLNESTETSRRHLGSPSNDSPADFRAEPRPFTADSKYSFSAWKPKIKLFPRPATNESLAKPNKENSARQKLPSSIRIALRGGTNDDKSLKSEKSGKPTKSSKPQRSKKSKDLPELPPLLSTTREDKAPAIINSEDTPRSVRTLPKIISKQDLDHKPMPLAPVSPLSPVSMDASAPASRFGPPYQNNQAPISPSTLDPKASISSMGMVGMGPEKIRLMKALQQRNRQLSDASTPSTAAVGDRKPEKRTASNIKVDTGPKTEADSGVVLEGANGRTTPVKYGSGSQASRSSPQAAAGRRENRSPGEKQPFVSVFSSSTYSASREPEQEQLSNGVKVAQTAQRVTVPRRRSQDKSRRRTNGGDRFSQTKPMDESDGFATDDSLMEELQFAKLEEAQQVAIPHSPTSPTESTGGGQKWPSATERRPTVTTVKPVVYHRTVPSGGQTSNQSQPLTGQMSALSQPRSSQDRQRPPPRKPNASAGLSRRIQTLAELSSKENEARTSYAQTLGNRPLLINPQRGTSATRPPSSQASPSRSVAQPPTSNSTVTNGGYSQFSSKPMSITARIVRPSTGDEGDTSPLRGRPSLDLQPSEVTIQEEPGSGDDARSTSRFGFRRVDRPPSLTSRPGSRGSVLSDRSKRSVDLGLNFMSFRGNESTSPGRSEQPASMNSLETVDEMGNERNESKASRLLRRMSGMGKTVNTANTSRSRRSSNAKQAALGGCIVGDLNVQFPDTLLWKRRWVEIDPSGFLILSAPTSQERQRSAPKRYHMTELMRPVIPSQDGQELPHSVLFDLLSGGTLQLACEDPIGQAQVLKRLSDSHSAWTN